VITWSTGFQSHWEIPPKS